MPAARCSSRRRSRRAPTPAAGRCLRPDQLAGIEAGLTAVDTRWLALVPATGRAPLVLRDPRIDLDSSDIEVYGRTTHGIGWSYTGVRSARVRLTSWGQAELPLAMELMAGNDDVGPRAAELQHRALTVLPAAGLWPAEGPCRRRLLRRRPRARRRRRRVRRRDRREAQPGCLDAGAGAAGEEMAALVLGAAVAVT